MGCQENLIPYVKNINKNIKTKWRPNYEVIDETFFEETDIFHNILDLCENSNQNQFLLSYSKIVMKVMAMEQGLYSKLVMISQKDLYNK